MNHNDVRHAMQEEDVNFIHWDFTETRQHMSCLLSG